MKFGKSIRREARNNGGLYLVDFKYLKRIVKKTEQTNLKDKCKEAIEGNFREVLREELRRVNETYQTNLEDTTLLLKCLQEQFAELSVEANPSKYASLTFEELLNLLKTEDSSDGLSDFCLRLSEVMLRCKNLRRYVIWNSVAVVKIIKKWRKHTSSKGYKYIKTAEVLSAQTWYSSPQLPEILSCVDTLQDELMQRLTLLPPSPERYTCPICLDLIVDPVAIRGCCHRFCWNCLARSAQNGNSELETCPYCRTAFALEPDSFEVDGVLNRFLNTYFAEDTKNRQAVNESQRSFLLASYQNKNGKMKQPNKANLDVNLNTGDGNSNMQASSPHCNCNNNNHNDITEEVCCLSLANNNVNNTEYTDIFSSANIKDEKNETKLLDSSIFDDEKLLSFLSDDTKNNNEETCGNNYANISNNDLLWSLLTSCHDSNIKGGDDANNVYGYNTSRNKSSNNNNTNLRDENNTHCNEKNSSNDDINTGIIVAADGTLTSNDCTKSNDSSSLIFPFTYDSPISFPTFLFSSPESVINVGHVEENIVFNNHHKNTFEYPSFAETATDALKEIKANANKGEYKNRKNAVPLDKDEEKIEKNDTNERIYNYIFNNVNYTNYSSSPVLDDNHAGNYENETTDGGFSNNCKIFESKETPADTTNVESKYYEKINENKNAYEGEKKKKTTYSEGKHGYYAFNKNNNYNNEQSKQTFIALGALNGIKENEKACTNNDNVSINHSTGDGTTNMHSSSINIENFNKIKNDNCMQTINDQCYEEKKEMYNYYANSSRVLKELLLLDKEDCRTSSNRSNDCNVSNNCDSRTNADDDNTHDSPFKYVNAAGSEEDPLTYLLSELKFLENSSFCYSPLRPPVRSSFCSFSSSNTLPPTSCASSHILDSEDSSSGGNDGSVCGQHHHPLSETSESHEENKKYCISNNNYNHNNNNNINNLNSHNNTHNEGHDNMLLQVKNHNFSLQPSDVSLKHFMCEKEIGCKSTPSLLIKKDSEKCNGDDEEFLSFLCNDNNYSNNCDDCYDDLLNTNQSFVTPTFPLLQPTEEKILSEHFSTGNKKEQKEQEKEKEKEEKNSGGVEGTLMHFMESTSCLDELKHIYSPFNAFYKNEQWGCGNDFNAHKGLLIPTERNINGGGKHDEKNIYEFDASKTANGENKGEEKPKKNEGRMPEWQIVEGGEGMGEEKSNRQMGRDDKWKNSNNNTGSGNNNNNSDKANNNNFNCYNRNNTKVKEKNIFDVGTVNGLKKEEIEPRDAAVFYTHISPPPSIPPPPRTPRPPITTNDNILRNSSNNNNVKNNGRHNNNNNNIYNNNNNNNSDNDKGKNNMNKANSNSSNNNSTNIVKSNAMKNDADNSNNNNKGNKKKNKKKDKSNYSSFDESSSSSRRMAPIPPPPLDPHLPASSSSSLSLLPSLEKHKKEKTYYGMNTNCTSSHHSTTCLLPQAPPPPPPSLAAPSLCSLSAHHNEGNNLFTRFLNSNDTNKNKKTNNTIVGSTSCTDNNNNNNNNNNITECIPLIPLLNDLPQRKLKGLLPTPSTPPDILSLAATIAQQNAALSAQNSLHNLLNNKRNSVQSTTDSSYNNNTSINNNNNSNNNNSHCGYHKNNKPSSNSNNLMSNGNSGVGKKRNNNTHVDNSSNNNCNFDKININEKEHRNNNNNDKWETLEKKTANKNSKKKASSNNSNNIHSNNNNSNNNNNNSNNNNNNNSNNNSNSNNSNNNVKKQSVKNTDGERAEFCKNDHCKDIKKKDDNNSLNGDAYSKANNNNNNKNTINKNINNNINNDKTTGSNSSLDTQSNSETHSSNGREITTSVITLPTQLDKRCSYSSTSPPSPPACFSDTSVSSPSSLSSFPVGVVMVPSTCNQSSSTSCTQYYSDTAISNNNNCNNSNVTIQQQYNKDNSYVGSSDTSNMKSNVYKTCCVTNNNNNSNIEEVHVNYQALLHTSPACRFNFAHVPTARNSPSAASSTSATNSSICYIPPVVHDNCSTPYNTTNTTTATPRDSAAYCCANIAGVHTVEANGTSYPSSPTTHFAAYAPDEMSVTNKNDNNNVMKDSSNANTTNNPSSNIGGTSNSLAALHSANNNTCNVNQMVGNNNICCNHGSSNINNSTAHNNNNNNNNTVPYVYLHNNNNNNITGCNTAPHFHVGALQQHFQMHINLPSSHYLSSYIQASSGNVAAMNNYNSSIYNMRNNSTEVIDLINSSSSSYESNMDNSSNNHASISHHTNNNCFNNKESVASHQHMPTVLQPSVGWLNIAGGGGGIHSNMCVGNNNNNNSTCISPPSSLCATSVPPCTNQGRGGEICETVNPVYIQMNNASFSPNMYVASALQNHNNCNLLSNAGEVEITYAAKNSPQCSAENGGGNNTSRNVPSSDAGDKTKGEALSRLSEKVLHQQKEIDYLKKQLQFMQYALLNNSNNTPLVSCLNENLQLHNDGGNVCTLNNHQTTNSYVVCNQNSNFANGLNGSAQC